MPTTTCQRCIPKSQGIRFASILVLKMSYLQNDVDEGDDHGGEVGADRPIGWYPASGRHTSLGCLSDGFCRICRMYGRSRLSVDCVGALIGLVARLAPQHTTIWPNGPRYLSHRIDPRATTSIIPPLRLSDLFLSIRFYPSEPS